MERRNYSGGRGGKEQRSVCREEEEIIMGYHLFCVLLSH